MNENWRKDPDARTLSYFVSQTPVHVNQDVIDGLIQVYRETRQPVRLCLHASTKDAHHDMIVLLPKGKEVQPHAHPHKEETLHVMKGTLGLIHYDEHGRIVEHFKLQPGDLFRVPANYIHWTLPLSEFVVFHESAPGPYHPETSSIRPAWAPESGGSKEAEPWLSRAYDLFEEKK